MKFVTQNVSCTVLRSSVYVYLVMTITNANVIDIHRCFVVW